MNYKNLFNFCFKHSDNLFILLSENLVILDINSSAEIILGWTKNNIYNQNISKMFKQYRTKLFIKDAPVKRTTTTTEVVHENNVLMINWEITPIGSRDGTSVILVLGKILKQSTNPLDNILIYAPGLVYWKDVNSVYQGCNDEFARLAGLKSRDQVIGKTDFDLIWKDSAALYIASDQPVLKTGKPNLNVEEVVATAENKKLTMISNKVPLLNDKNQVIGVMGITTDITAQKMMAEDLKLAKEKAEVASLAKTEFLENMRHDIRTPLTGIVGFADLLKMESDNPHIKEYSENLVASSHALLDLLDEVLEAIRVSSGEIPKLKKKFSLEQTLSHVVELNRSRAAQKKLSLSLHIDTAIPNYVIGDKVRIHRVALELIANALNFTDTGYVKLSIVLAKRHEEKLVLKLVVEDSGIGIPKEKQQEIYVQFKRLTPSYQGIYKGAGLGLAVVKQFIDELGGEIYVESEPRKGTCFTCIIPVQEPLLDDALGVDDELEKTTDTPYETTYSQQIKPTINNASNHSFRVLVVEDNAIAQAVAKSILAQLRCDTDLAATGKEALELWKNGRYNLVFMDIGLPDSDGYAVTHQIRIQELAKKTHIPIIALTAHAGVENKQRCIEAGMNAVLTKPLTAKSCTDILDAFIPGYHSQQSTPEKASYSSELPDNNEALFHLAEFPILDIEEGIKTSGNESMLAEMLTFMVNESLPQDLELMKEAHATLDWDKTQQFAHKIKGGAVYVGTIKIKMACQYLERYWKSGQRDLMEPLYQQAIAVIEESMQEIDCWLQNK
jgi:two-component system aerobic respiration control sensor histidine kinase ArcB